MAKYFDSMIFDLDGTLWNAVANITLLWNEAIKGEADITSALKAEEVTAIMGLNTKEIGHALFPDLSPLRQEEVMAKCCAAESQKLPAIGGTLYPGVAATLKKLKAVMPLFIVSNCDCGYIEAFLAYHSLADNFTAFLSYGDTGQDKAENIRTIVRRYQLQKPVYVGDTHKDRLAAAAAGVAFLHAAYGFGAEETDSKAITTFSELLKYV